MYNQYLLYTFFSVCYSHTGIGLPPIYHIRQQNRDFAAMFFKSLPYSLRSQFATLKNLLLSVIYHILYLLLTSVWHMVYLFMDINLNVPYKVLEEL